MTICSADDPPGPSPRQQQGSSVRPAVTLLDAAKRYGRRPALAGVDLVLHPGEVVGFIGPNGAGKTTLIKMLSGFIRPTSGTVEVLGKDLTRRPVAPDGVALVQESPTFIPYLSGKKNLTLLAGIRKVATSADIDATLDTVGLDPADSRPARTYSLGMRQRLGLAQALMERPLLLLLDEPTNGLDPQGIIELRTLIRRLAEAGTAIFLASHLLTEVERVCDRVLLVQHGRVQKEFDHREADTPIVRLSVSSQQDMSTLRHWADSADTPMHPTAGIPLSVELVTESPVPQLVRELVNADINVEAIARARRSLEREFMQLLGNEENQ